jgi:hypothetical protein
MSFWPQTIRRALITVGLSFVFFPLASCGNGNMLGNGTGNPGTALGALQIANTDIANGNYNGAISVLAPYCPNNTCVNPDIANAYANAYIALGNGTSGPGGATITQILSQVLNLVNTNASATQVLQGVNQAIPCLASNSCQTPYLDNLATALQTLANTPCSGSTTTATNCPDSSSILLASAVYLLAVAQYETGIVYTNGSWQLCPKNGGGLSSGCASLSESALATDLSGSTLLPNIAAILGASCSGCSGSATISVTTTTALNVLPYFLASLGSSNTNIATSFNQFLNAINTCSTNPTSGCAASPSGTAPSSVTLSPSGLAYYLSQL